jgi:hypothetical protein
MAELTRKQRIALETILYHAKRAERYINQPSVAIARKGGIASTTLHCVNQQGTVLYEIDKGIGSDITGLYDAVRSLEHFLNPPIIEVEV